MRIAAVVGADGDTIVPLADGPVVVIFDSERGTVQKHDNPGWGLATGRRMVTTRFLISQGVEAACSVPETFCSTSCEAAVQGGIKFIRLPVGARWSGLLANPAHYLQEEAACLPAMELFVKPGAQEEVKE